MPAVRAAPKREGRQKYSRHTHVQCRSAGGCNVKPAWGRLLAFRVTRDEIWTGQTVLLPEAAVYLVNEYAPRRNSDQPAACPATTED
jgi:hypothetical protein